MANAALAKNRTQLDVERIMQSFAAEMETTDRIICRNGDLTAAFVPASPGVPHDCPAWMDGKNISFNSMLAQGMLTDPSVSLSDFVQVFKGTNYHEAAHGLFTPRDDSFLCKEVRVLIRTHSDAWNTFMMLEDQRIELFYTTLYAGTTPYFVMAATQWLIKQMEGVDPAKENEVAAGLFPLIHGRKFLPVAIRDRAESAFTQVNDAALTAQVKAIIDAYQTCCFPLDSDKGLSLIKQMCDLFPSIPGGGGKCGDNRGTLTSLAKGDPSQDEQHKAGKAVEKAQEKAKEADAKDGEDGKSPAKGKGTGDSDKKPGEDAGSGDGCSPGGDTGTEKFSDLAEAALDAAKRSEEMKRDVDRTVKAVKRRVDSKTVFSKAATRKMRGMNANTTMASNRVIAALRQLKIDLEPCWNHGKTSGKPNARRVLARTINPTDLNVFDKWWEGDENSADTEVVILLDQSTSMRQIMPECSKALWALKRAFDKYNMTCSVFGYSLNGQVTNLYRPQDKAEKNGVPEFPVISGTNAASAVKQAKEVLSRSKATHKVLIIITDGSWDDSHIADRIIEQMTKAGVTTALFGFGGSLNYGSHRCKITSQMTSANDVAAAVKQIVTTIIRGARR